MIISKKLKLKALFTGLICIFLFTGAYAANPIKIMLYGDSLMAGYGLSQNENLASELTRNFEDNNFTVSVINASISGNTSKARVSIGIAPGEPLQKLHVSDSLQVCLSTKSSV